MARPAQGYVEWRKPENGNGPPHWHAQLTVKGKRSPWVPLDPRIPFGERGSAAWEHAKRAAKVVSDDERERGYVVDAKTTQTLNEYGKTWLESREGRIATVRDNAGHLDHHILPVIGTLEIARLTRADVERVVSALDAKVRGGKLSPKTAKGVWGTLSKLLDDATNAKPATGLRCLEIDPSAGVRGPDDDGADKLLQFLYPSEFATFVASEDVPLYWRRNVAIAVYLCLRVGEQAALKWSAVDLEHGVVTLQETFDRRTRADREGTKSGAARMVPIRSELLPLLMAMHDESGGKGHVCRLPAIQDLADRLRRWLKRAGVDREALHTGTSVSKPLRWHDLRASGATWLAVEGRSPTEIRDILGHTMTSMTDRYMRSAAVLRGGRFGTPFPALPSSLVTSRREPPRARNVSRSPSAAEAEIVAELSAVAAVFQSPSTPVLRTTKRLLGATSEPVSSAGPSTLRDPVGTTTSEPIVPFSS